MGFVGKIAKTTENPAIKYKSLKHSGLYLIFHRFSILFIDLVGVHEVLPHDVGGRADRGDRQQVGLRHPDRQHGVFLSQSLCAGDFQVVFASDAASDNELAYACDERGAGQQQLVSVPG